MIYLILGRVTEFSQGEEHQIEDLRLVQACDELEANNIYLRYWQEMNDNDAEGSYLVESVTFRPMLTA
jgi:hypothetical protein